MIRRATIRRRLAWTALVVLLCSVVASLRLRQQSAERRATPAGCPAAGRDSAALARFASDTLGLLRGRTQRVQSFTRRPDGVDVRTEDIDPLALHDGGLVAFRCDGRVTFLWLDGG